MVHRLSYEIFKGRIKKNMTIYHTCRNTLCVNPNHLRQISLRDNILAGISPAAVNAQKTHCPKGHEYKGYNIKLTKEGRSCRICCNEYMKKYHRRLKNVNL